MDDVGEPMKEPRITQRLRLILTWKIPRKTKTAMIAIPQCLDAVYHSEEDVDLVEGGRDCLEWLCMQMESICDLKV